MKKINLSTRYSTEDLTENVSDEMTLRKIKNPENELTHQQMQGIGKLQPHFSYILIPY